jgi:hypothetical protein
VSYVIDGPIRGGGVFRVQAADADLPPGLELVALRPGEVVARASESLNSALDQLRPAVEIIRRPLEVLAPHEVSAVVAKGTAEVHFTISLKWAAGDA